MKHSESERLKRYNGRVCFQCNHVVVASGARVVFAEIGASASLASGARIVDKYALCAGNTCEQSDAPKAYT